MPRSVTRAVLIVGGPLVTLAAIGILGSQPPHPVVPSPLIVKHTATLGSLQAGVNSLRQMALRATPPPTPAPTAPPAPAPAPVAAQPAPVHPAPPPPPPPPPPVSSVGGAAGTQFSLINQDRAANGVAPLAYSAALGRVAQYRAQDMLSRNYFSHYDPSTGQLAFVGLLRLWGIPYSTAGENIAWSTNPSMGAINTMFMNSPEHRANILKAPYHRVGLGVASNGAKIMVVEVFSN
ncbi:MAG: CAP domain-containing protein [Candidatus Dormibacteraeota bacterium]|nr:CAP domain-containing protein [Candidatus Dormibacteraeota bacterium]